MINTLAVSEVLYIHRVLTDDFAETDDPISPPGVREDGRLVQSAVDRQHVGFQGKLKYDDAVSNAATLCFGVCRNHGFHNGNKRAALVSLLCHLDKNGMTIRGNVDQGELYTLMLRIASRHFAPKNQKFDASDVEVQAIASWLRTRTRNAEHGEKVITFRELRRILRRFDVELENPRGNFIDVVRYSKKRAFLGFGREEVIAKRVAHIPYPREGAVVGRNVLRAVRERCGLDERSGCDSKNFYGDDIAVDQFITNYKKTLKRLAKI